jgi:2-methylcitrate dehydratase PrpD
MTNPARRSPRASPVVRKLSAYIAGALRRRLPPEVVECAKHHLLDTLAAMISGTTLAPGRRAIRFVRSLGGAPEATVVGTRIRTNAIHAALANGMAAHADETDDSHSPSLTHPGCGIVSAALAMAERERANGTALLRAVALGYDVCTRLSLSLGGVRFGALGHLTHCFGNTFGAAAACAALARLDAGRVCHVLTYAAQQASGLSTYGRDLEHVEKAFDFGGMPARNGVTAAVLVASGCTAAEDVFSGDRNFFLAYDESRRSGRRPDPHALVDGLGKRWEIARTNIKRWSVGSPIQAALDSLLEIVRAQAVRPRDVREIIVRVYSSGARITDNRDMPDVNMQHLCALMVADGYVTFRGAHDRRRMTDPRVVDIRRRVRLIGDPALEKRRPEKHAIVEVVLRDGRRLRHHTHAVRGTYQNPMTRREVGEKCLDLMAPVLGARRARGLCEAVWRIGRVADVRALRPLIAR